MERADPPDTDDRVDEYLARVRSLPGDSVAGAFAPPTAHERADPHDAFAETFIADAPMDGPLADLDLAVKENVAVGGVRTTCGTDCFEWTPETDAVAVERLRAAGGTVVGTTDMDPFAFGTTGELSARGPTENPAAEGYVPGGSSSGSAAAVAGGSVDAALGTDTAGSVRIPAAFCGIVGYKPTFGMVPTEGVVPLSPSNDHVGVLARTVETAARVLEATAGQEATRPASLGAPARLAFVDDLDREPDDLRFGVPDAFMAAATPTVEAAAEAAVTRAAVALDAEIDSVGFPEAEAAVDANDAGTVMEFGALLEQGSLLGTGARADLRAALKGPVESFLERDALCCVNWASTPGLGAAMREMAAHDPDGGVLCVDPGPLTVAGARDLLAALRSLGPAYDVVVSVNEDEAARLGAAVGGAVGDPTDASLLDAVRARAGGTGGVDEASVVVHGTDAAVAATPTGRVTVPTLDVSPGPTETGAGDRFSGALARSLAADWGWELALAAGNACATHYVSGRGTATRSTLLDHVETHDPS